MSKSLPPEPDQVSPISPPLIGIRSLDKKTGPCSGLGGQGGAFLDSSGECVPCGVGMCCLGMGEVDLMPGYYSPSDRPGFVFHCYGDERRCPGGLPGTCGDHRQNGSITCYECDEGYALGGRTLD